MNQVLQKMYEGHHAERNRFGFTMLEEERGELFKRFVGTNKKVLDVGCRDGSLTKFFVQGNTVVGADIDMRALEKAKETLGIETVFVDLNGEWEEIGERTFDVVTAGEIVEHLFYPAKVIQRAYAHLGEGGVFVGSVPNAFSLKNRIRLLFGLKKNTPLSDPTHINHFTYAELESLLKAQFSNVEIHGIGRHKMLAKVWPGMMAFGFVFVARK
jgi:2-polyprenyl-3-methyl-5-hydroxy-6-metoxy-1,4-benzoquinol methylase